MAKKIMTEVMPQERKQQWSVVDLITWPVLR